MLIKNQMFEAAPPKVAVLDDDSSMVAAVSEVLAAYGFSVSAFTSQDQFIRTTDIFAFDGYILDWNLQGSNCLSLLESIRQTPTGRAKPIFILTGDAQAAHGKPCELVSAVHRLNLIFCQKPYSTKKLAIDLKAAFSEPQN